jgi:hypothetical protein
MYSLFERFKWTVLDHADFGNAGIAYPYVRRAYPEASPREHDQLIQRALLELFDEGLISFWWGGWDDGSDAHRPRRPATRDEAEAELALPGDAPPRETTIWFMETEAGKAKFHSLGPDALLSSD